MSIRTLIPATLGLLMLSAAAHAAAPQSQPGGQPATADKPGTWTELRKGLKFGKRELDPATGKPQGWSDQSYYLPMRDGVRIAVSLYFPEHRVPTRRSPIMLVQTRYGRAGGGGSRYEPWLKAGYVMAVVDTRGSTASFGDRKVDIGPDEVRDMDEIIAHLAAQPWSSGQVIAWGFSYLADTADWTTGRPAPALLAAVPRETDFDAYLNLFFPGGVSNDWFLFGWGENARDIDLGRNPDKGLDCVKRVGDCAQLYPTLQPVDADPDFKLIRQAMTGRPHWGPEDYAKTAFRDEPGANGYSIFDSSPASSLADIRKQRKPVQYWGSWVDGGTAEAALARFRSTPGIPAEVWITAHDHSQTRRGDPFTGDQKSPIPTLDEQLATQMDFQDRVLKGQKIDRLIHYYVMGSGTFHTAETWPPAGLRTSHFALGSGAQLTLTPPSQNAVDRYNIDVTATTGKTTRWSTQGGAPPDYADRRNEDKKLQVYDGPKQTEDMELAGTPVVTLYLAASFNDPAVFVYLEDVAPDGRVTYLTEGELRAIHRKPADPSTLPYDQGPAPHSFRRADALPVTPGEVMKLQFALQPVAALIRKDHSLRLAIAGTDADTFHRYPPTTKESFLIHHGKDSPSGLEVSMRPWKP